MSLHDLPAVNAALNAVSATCLVAGFACIRSRRVAAHRACMLAAFASSCLFLVSYLVYHAQVGTVRFQGQGLLRGVYLAILASHTVLAAAVPPLAILTLRRALRAEFPRHARLARWTLPVWLYVSATGILVYGLLYHVDRAR